MITSSEIKTQLQIYNACAIQKATQYIDGLSKGKKCDDKWHDAKVMFSMIDSVKGFVPEGEIVSGTQATGQLKVLTAGIIPLVLTVNITIGSYAYSKTWLSFQHNTKSIVIAGIVDTINAQFPSAPYTAQASGDFIIITGTNYSNDNGVAITCSAVSGVTPVGNVQAITPTMTGGTVPVLQGANCISNNSIENILNKLKKLCSTPCEKIVNFQNQCKGLLLERWGGYLLVDDTTYLCLG